MQKKQAHGHRCKQPVCPMEQDRSPPNNKIAPKCFVLAKIPSAYSTVPNFCIPFVHPLSAERVLALVQLLHVLEGFGKQPGKGSFVSFPPPKPSETEKKHPTGTISLLFAAYIHLGEHLNELLCIYLPFPPKIASCPCL